MPSATMNVACSVKTVGAVTLPEGWAWEAEDAAKALIAGEAEPAPETPAVPAEDKKYVVYVVKKGDTLRAISQQCGCTVKEIMELNREQIKDADMISIGWELTVPEK